MKKLCTILFFIVCNSNSFSQNDIKSKHLSKKENKKIDFSALSENERALVNYMETLSDEQALEFAKSFILGDYFYKEEQTNNSAHKEKKKRERINDVEKKRVVKDNPF